MEHVLSKDIDLLRGKIPNIYHFPNKGIIFKVIIPVTKILKKRKPVYELVQFERLNDSINKGDCVIANSDMLAAGGSANYTGSFIKKSGDVVADYSFN